jgi:uncharacterized protein YaiI (UPF0178 family)
MRIWVDADACPRAILDIILRAALRRGVAVVFVANKDLPLPSNPLISSVRVQRGADIADAHIAANTQAGDMVITHDIPLAAQLVAIGAIVIDPRGDLYDEDNIRERLSIRNFMHQLREDGVRTGGPAAFGQKSRQHFADTFDRELTRALRAAGMG